MTTAILTTSDREIIGGMTQIGGATSNPTMAGDDRISLFGTFLSPPTSAGLIDDRSGTDMLAPNSADLTGTTLAGTERTEIANTGKQFLEVSQLADPATVALAGSAVGGTGFIRWVGANGDSGTLTAALTDGEALDVDSFGFASGETLTVTLSASSTMTAATPTRLAPAAPATTRSAAAAATTRVRGVGNGVLDGGFGLSNSVSHAGSAGPVVVDLAFDLAAAATRPATRSRTSRTSSDPPSTTSSQATRRQTRSSVWQATIARCPAPVRTLPSPG